MLSLLIRRARVVDGSGAPSTGGDVAVADGRVVAVEAAVDQPAERVIDADGRVVCPGFIDLHSHVDFMIRRFPRADGMLRQGVTTIVTGNCGMTPYPATDGSNGPRWPDLAAFAAELSDAPLAVNVAPLVGHGAVRRAAMADPGREATDEEVRRMAELVENAMRQGAHGLSTGLIYDPGRFSDTAEIIALARVVARHGGFYASHIRGESDTLVDAVSEAIEIGRAAGVAVHISHHKAKRRRNWGRVTTTLAMIDDAVASGVDVMLDCYPYTASSTSLEAYLPHWARAGELLAMGDELPAEVRSRLMEGLEQLYPGSSAGDGADTDLNDLTISHVRRRGPYSRYEGRRLHEAAYDAGVSPADFVIDVLMAGRAVQVIDHAMSDDDMRTVLDHPRCAVASDARRIHQSVRGLPHPRSFGTFTRFLQKIAPGRMTLETAIHKCTGLPARRLGWTGNDDARGTGYPGPNPAGVRGLIRPGAAADLLMFDPAGIQDHATFEDPKQYSTGMDLIVVNGTVVVEDDTDTGAAAGRFLLRTGGSA